MGLIIYEYQTGHFGSTIVHMFDTGANERRLEYFDNVNAKVLWGMAA